MTDQPTLPKGRPAQSPHGAAGTSQQAQTQHVDAAAGAGGTATPGSTHPPIQFTPHEPTTGSPASSVAKTSGVLGAPAVGLLALAAVGIAGGGVGGGNGHHHGGGWNYPGYYAGQ